MTPMGSFLYLFVLKSRINGWSEHPTMETNMRLLFYIDRNLNRRVGMILTGESEDRAFRRLHGRERRGTAEVEGVVPDLLSRLVDLEPGKVGDVDLFLNSVISHSCASHRIGGFPTFARLQRFVGETFGREPILVQH